MNKIIFCKYCGGLEYYGEMRWLSGKCCCRDCYKLDFETESGRLYEWTDLDGHRPTMEEFIKQEQ